MELGIYSFGSRARDPETGTRASTAQATRNLLEAIELADEVGLDFFGIGEHHTSEQPGSAAAVVLAAAATRTRRIRLGSAVTVLSTEDPVRVFQQFATLDDLSGGRAEITAGRGSSTESFPLFGYDLSDYDHLYAEKLDLLLALNAMHEGERLTWHGTLRPSISDMEVVPRPHGDRLRIWLGTGGNPGSSVRAATLGLPVFYGIIGGEPARFSRVSDLYRGAAERSGMPEDQRCVSVGTPGFVAARGDEARERWWPEYLNTMEQLSAARGLRTADRAAYDHGVGPDGALFVGSPDEIAEKVVRLHGALGHVRHVLQMDWGALPHRDLLASIELLGTEVRPRVERLMAADHAALVR